MLGFIISSNYDALFAPTIKLIDEFVPIFIKELDIYEKSLINNLKYKISKLDGTYISELVNVVDNALVFKDGIKGFSNNFDTIIEKVNLPLFRVTSSIIKGEPRDYDELKSILQSKGTLYLFEYIRRFNINSYIVNTESFDIDIDPFEFLLIQFGLQRINHVPFEDDRLNIETNIEAWNRYNNPRVNIYEYNTLPARWIKH